jgi:hypothetical protein
MRQFHYKQLRCRWEVSGPHISVHVLVVHLAGYEDPRFLVTTVLDLSASQIVAVWVARFRQEDGLRDHKQHLGMEECRAWTKEPILRTFQVQLVALTLLRLLQASLEPGWGAGTWWAKPEWNRRKRYASILDLRRLFWRYGPEFSRFSVAMEELKKIPQPPYPEARSHREGCRNSWKLRINVLGIYFSLAYLSTPFVPSNLETLKSVLSSNAGSFE